LRPVVVDRGASWMHRLDPRAKLVPLLVFLVALGTAHRALPWVAAGLFLLLAAGLISARIPLSGALSRAALVLPFSLVFGAACWLAGDPARGVALAVKSYLSALAVLLVASATPLPDLLRGIESAHAPRLLLMVAQFLFRYLFVISEEGRHMSWAAASRGASLRAMAAGRSVRFRAAAGALAVLFARSYARAEEIHRSMLGRGFSGRFPSLDRLHFRTRDGVFAALASLAAAAVRAAAERMA